MLTPHHDNSSTLKKSFTGDGGAGGSLPIQINYESHIRPQSRWQPQSDLDLDLDLDLYNAMNSQVIKEEKSSPATEALDYDANSLMFDLTELLKRDPTLSTLQSTGSSSISNAMPIPSNRRDLIGDTISTSASDTIDGVHTASSSVPPFGSSVGSAVSPLAISSNSPSLYAPASTPVVPPNVTLPVVSLGGLMPRVPSSIKMETDEAPDFDQPTLAQLNSPSPAVVAAPTMLTTAGGNDELLKLELNDLDVDLNQYFINDSSRDVSFGAAAAYNSSSLTGSTGIRGKSVSFSSGTKPASLGAASRITQPMSAVQPGFLHQDDSMLFSSTSMTNQSGGSTFIGAKDLLSSSVPASIFHNSPLSDILTELSAPPSSSATSNSAVGLNSPSVSPGLAGNSPSQAGPERNHHSQLHKLLLRKDPVGVASRPSPVRSPESRKMTLDKIRNSLSASNPLLTQQLSNSAPAQPNYLDSRQLWSRREPRQHISSVCSVGNESSIADEVSEALNGISPSELPDIESDDEIDEEDEDEESGMAGKDSSDEDESGDEEGATGSGGAPGTSSGSKGSKKEKHFWQYNVQAKGPKGQKIYVETKIEDPHHLNEIVDPVFSGNVQLQGIKHSGKARRGDGNDLTSNPKKLAAIGKELDQLSSVINDLTPPSEMPFNTRCKSRKEKNKLASRACRLKKKAQHEANKLKCSGLEEEHHDLSEAIKTAKDILRLKVAGNSQASQPELTQKMEALVKNAQKNKVAGHTSEYVTKQINRFM